jgi:hypothetical protein
VTTLHTPGGKPASRNMSPRKRPAAKGECSLGFITTVLPAAKGAATDLTPRMMGAFQGAKAATTPAGWRRARDSEPGIDVGMTSPIGWVTRAAASLSISVASCTLKWPPAGHGTGLFSHERHGLLGAALEHVGGPQQEAAALDGKGRRPGPEGAVGGVHGQGGILGPGGGHGGHHVARVGVDVGCALATDGSHVVGPDKQLAFGYHGTSVPGGVLVVGCARAGPRTNPRRCGTPSPICT